MNLLRSFSIVFLLLAVFVSGCERFDTDYAGIKSDKASGMPAPSGTVDPHKKYE